MTALFTQIKLNINGNNRVFNQIFLQTLLTRSDRLQQLEQQYARLKSLNADRHEKLEELVVLTEFRRSMDELERWIREKEQIASNEETGEWSS